MQMHSKCLFFLAVTSCTGSRDPVLCLGSSSGRSAPREALLVWPRSGGGPLGRFAGRLRRGEGRHGAGGDQPGETQQHQEEYASTRAPQGNWLLSRSGENMSQFKLLLPFSSSYSYREETR